jgi:hypothetical protein
MGRPKGSKNLKNRKPEPPKKQECKPIEKEKPLRVEGVSARKETPSIPTVLVDGGMLYRFLLELRRGYDDFIVDKDAQSKKGTLRVIDEIMEYIMRMEKK